MGLSNEQLHTLNFIRENLRQSVSNMSYYD